QSEAQGRVQGADVAQYRAHRALLAFRRVHRSARRRRVLQQGARQCRAQGHAALPALAHIGSASHGCRGRSNRGFPGRIDRRDLPAADAGAGSVRPGARPVRRMKLKKKLFLGLLAVALVFGAGAYYGRSSKHDMVISSSTAGASYGGGFKGVGAETAAGAIRSVAGPTPTNVVIVKDGQSIQAAVKAAPRGTVIRVMPGTYHETVYIDKDDIRIVGVIEEGRRAVLDGEKKLNDAILYSGNNFVAENLEIRNYKGNGIMGQAGNNFEIRNNVIASSGVYGIFPQLGQNGIVEHNVVSGIADAAIYIGMSDNILVAHNEVFDSVAGIEIENSRHAIVEHNYVHEDRK